jgi:hypothetical protein
MMSQWHVAERVTIHGGGTATDFHCFPLFRLQDHTLEPLANVHSLFIPDYFPCQQRQDRSEIWPAMDLFCEVMETVLRPMKKQFRRRFQTSTKYGNISALKHLDNKRSSAQIGIQSTGF